MTESERLHVNAMELASLAYIHKSKGDEDSYLDFTKKALDLEVRAAKFLTDEYDAEPTRSILFRSAASLAYNCNELRLAENLIFAALSGTPDPSLVYELRELLDRVNSVLLGVADHEENGYLDYLRDTAVHLRVQAKTKIHSKAVFVKNAVDFLKNLSNSYSNFVSVNFKKSFSVNSFGDSYNKVLSQLITDTQLLVVDQRFKSFGVSVSSDTSIMQNYYSDQINNWRKQLFAQFKDEVLYIDYTSRDAAEYISTKYNGDERFLIYKNFMSSFKEKNGYRVSITNKHYSETLKEYNPIPKSIDNIFVPRFQKENLDGEKVLYQEFFMDVKNSQKPAKKSNIIERKILDYAEFTHTITKIEAGDDYLVLVEEWPIKIIYEMGSFIVDLDELNIHLRLEDYSTLVNTLYKEVITLYDRLNKTKNEDLSIDDRAIKDVLFNIIAMRSMN